MTLWDLVAVQRENCRGLVLCSYIIRIQNIYNAIPDLSSEFDAKKVMRPVVRLYIHKMPVSRLSPKTSSHPPSVLFLSHNRSIHHEPQPG